MMPVQFRLKSSQNVLCHIAVAAITVTAIIVAVIKAATRVSVAKAAIKATVIINAVTTKNATSAINARMLSVVSKSVMANDF